MKYHKLYENWNRHLNEEKGTTFEDETVLPPEFLQSAQAEDSAAQENVLKAAEQRWGLPFTNRDIRLLFMKYLEKFDSLIAEKNFDDAATITGRAADYVDNLMIKLYNGTFFAVIHIETINESIVLILKREACYEKYAKKISKNYDSGYFCRGRRVGHCQRDDS